MLNTNLVICCRRLRTLSLGVVVMFGVATLHPSDSRCEDAPAVATPVPANTASSDNTKVAPIDAKGVGNIPEGFSIEGRATAIAKAKELEGK